jgi:hypothetical protein
MRMPTSVAPPAAHGTISVTGRAGKLCACACAAPALTAKANPAVRTVAKTLRFTAVPSRHRPIFCDRLEDQLLHLVTFSAENRCPLFRKML